MFDLMQSSDYIANAIFKEVLDSIPKEPKEIFLSSTRKIGLLVIDSMLKSCASLVYTKYGKAIPNPDYEKLKNAKIILISKFDLR